MCLLQYTPAIDIWSIGCIFAEIVTGKPLFPGKNVVHQLDLITDLLGSPSTEAISRVCSIYNHLANLSLSRFLGALDGILQSSNYLSKFWQLDSIAICRFEMKRLADIWAAWGRNHLYLCHRGSRMLIPWLFVCLSV